jgi:alginate O-acetyltransferase complex protein AlgI
MLFNSYVFLLGFLPMAVVIYRLADPHPRLRTWTLIGLSLIFYGYWNPILVTLLVGSILVNWLAARYYAARPDHLIITSAVIANLLVLGIFKYANFFAQNLTWLSGAPPFHLELALPLGISFFTFHHIMYFVDLGRGRAKISPLDRYALYICFFPQAIAGPIARWSEVGHQYGREIFAPGWEHRAALGITFMVLGLAEKTMLGDPLGRVLDPIYEQAAIGPVIDGSAFIALGFGFQIFFDFAGYSDIAIGLGLLFGIHLPQNFDAPFRATSILEFWQRWHMTLSRFLRDYLFLPLADIRIAGRRRRTSQIVAAIVITMALCGLWHGAAWTFVLWGLLHGVAIITALGWRTYLPAMPRALGWAATLSFWLVTAVVFRAGTLDAAWHIFQGLSTAPEPTRIPGVRTLLIVALWAIVLPSSNDLCARLTDQPRRGVAALLGIVSASILVLLGGNQSYEFIYFQF